MAQVDRHVQNTVTVTGNGSVMTRPDRATVYFSVVSEHRDPKETRRMNEETARGVVSAVREMGIEESKIQLQALRLQPLREFDPQTRQYIEKGYAAVRQLKVELANIDQLPDLVSTVVDQGANRLDRVFYDIKDEDSYKDQALVKAVTRARNKAEIMAENLGVEVGSVLEIEEMNMSDPFPVLRSEPRATVVTAKSEGASGQDAFSAGEIEVQAAVRVVFRIH